MRKNNKTAFLDRLNNIIYFVEDHDFEQCYEKHTKNIFISMIKGGGYSGRRGFYTN